MVMYPPIVATAQPVFNYTNNEVRVYFALSPYDSQKGLADADAMQIVVKYQTNNRDATNSVTGIIQSSIESVSAMDDPVIGSRLAHYYITISKDKLQSSSFIPNTIYKVQLRFYKSATHSVLSEWSTVCLLKPIQVPTIHIQGFPDSDDPNADSLTNFYSIDPIFTGIYEPAKGSNETLKNWQMILYDGSGQTVLADSGIVDATIYATNETTPVECQLPYTMSDSTKYQLYFGIQTKNGYTVSITRTLMAYSYTTAKPDGEINLIINEEDGYAKILSRIELSTAGGSLTLRRTSSQSQFMIWEDIANKVFTTPSAVWDYYDFTIKSGVFYQYAIQKRDSYGRRSQSLRTDRLMGEFDSAFLVQKSESLDQAIQLKLRFDTSISSQLINISQTKTDTIGGKYPFVRRNGNMYYHTFPLSGLITTYMDNSHIFATDNELYDYEKDLYESAFGSHNLSVISGQYNYTLQREFREKVKTFLYDNKIKLFKSLTQGNMLIKLMDISLTPKEELGRLIYSFSATAVEVDEPTIKNFNKYGILNIGTYAPDIVWTDSVLGQLHYEVCNDDSQIEQMAFPNGANLMGDGEYKGYPTIKHQQHWGVSYNGASIQDLGLSYLKIEFEDDPYLIVRDSNSYRVFDDRTDNTTVQRDKLLYGYLIQIGNQKIFIEYPNTIYELKGSKVLFPHTTNITLLAPGISSDEPHQGNRNGCKLLLTYIADLSEQADMSTTAQSVVQFNDIGQIARLFTNSNSIWSLIWSRYFLDLYESEATTIGSDKFYIKVNAIYELQIEADPGSIFYVSTSSEFGKYHRMEIDESGILKIAPYKQHATIRDGYFKGICIDGRYFNRHTPYENLTSNEMWADLPTERPEDVYQYRAYKDGNTVYIYYNGEWYAGAPAPIGDETPAAAYNDRFAFDISYPVEALVNYYVSIEKGIYA